MCILVPERLIPALMKERLLAIRAINDGSMVKAKFLTDLNYKIMSSFDRSRFSFPVHYFRESS
jgi:hypothetical protein